MPSLCQNSVLKMEGEVGVGTSNREGEGQVVESPLSNSFICSSLVVILIATCKENRFGSKAQAK